MTTVLETRGLCAGYGTDAPVVRDVDLHVDAGEVVALLGANGAGKTTTLRALAGELPARQGEVRLDGRTTSAPLFRRARAGMSIVTEERNVVMTRTVRDNLRVSRCDAGRALALFPDLADHVQRTVAQLSGGQQQMLALAIALSRPTRVLLADELSLGLAPIVVDRLLRAVREAADHGVGVLLVEQHVHKALAVADRVYVMKRGRIELAGSSAEMGSRLGDIENSYLTGTA